MCYYIEVQVKPFVRKYIQARCGSAIFEVNKEDRIGKVLYAFLGRNPVRLEKGKFELGDKLMIHISERTFYNRGNYLSRESILEFNEQIKLEIIEEVAMYIWNLKSRIGLKKYNELYIRHSRKTKMRTRIMTNPDVFQYFEEKEVIYDVLKKYNITEDDFPFETLKKACQRLKLPLLSA